VFGLMMAIGPGQGGLDVPESGVHPLEDRRLGGTSATAGDVHAVAAAG